MSFRIRDARPGDEAVVVELIRALAEYEKMLDRCVATPELMREALFGAKPTCECVLAELDTGRIAGFALFHATFSTFMAKPGLWLEDLFVHPDLRGLGIGKALIAHGAKLCVARGYPRYEWSVLDWNAPSIAFYESLGAFEKTGWKTMRLDGAALAKLAAAT
ncbi:MAG: GNAT family N-acetyltransferase [Tagaea sp.]|nr:GNAT family N-acetyltransferase [Tagaea sp.]